MKIDKLGFYKSRDGHEVEIIFIDKISEYEFIAVGKMYFNTPGITPSLITYRDEDGSDEEDSDADLIEFLRPSGMEWPTSRKTSFVAYLDEDCKDHFSISDVGCIYLGLHPEKPDNPPGKLYRKISKWRFYAEELLED